VTRCPSCTTPLRQVVECDVEIDVCDKCHGVWLDAGELDTLAENNDFSPCDFSADEIHDLQCPRCSKRHFATITTGIGTFARCADCGGVFAGGETVDCLSESERSELPSKQTEKTIVMSADVLSSLLDLLWLFTHH
jgi:Zn-finger nucleic acid-binding protein